MIDRCNTMLDCAPCDGLFKSVQVGATPVSRTASLSDEPTGRDGRSKEGRNIHDADRDLFPPLPPRDSAGRARPSLDQEG